MLKENSNQRTDHRQHRGRLFGRGEHPKAERSEFARISRGLELICDPRRNHVFIIYGRAHRVVQSRPRKLVEGDVLEAGCRWGRTSANRARARGGTRPAGRAEIPAGEGRGRSFGLALLHVQPRRQSWPATTCIPRRSPVQRLAKSAHIRGYQAEANYFLIVRVARIAAAVGKEHPYNGKMRHLQKVCGKRQHAVPASARTCPARLAVGRSCLCTLRLASGYVASRQLLRLISEAEQHVPRRFKSIQICKRNTHVKEQTWPSDQYRMKAPSRRPWSKDDLRLLKGMAGKEPLAKIAETLKRTAGATRQKATNIGVSLRIAPKKRTPPTKGEGVEEDIARQCQQAGVFTRTSTRLAALVGCSGPPCSAATRPIVRCNAARGGPRRRLFAIDLGLSIDGLRANFGRSAALAEVSQCSSFRNSPTPVSFIFMLFVANLPASSPSANRPTPGSQAGSYAPGMKTLGKRSFWPRSSTTSGGSTGKQSRHSTPALAVRISFAKSARRRMLRCGRGACSARATLGGPTSLSSSRGTAGSFTVASLIGIA